MNSIHHGPYTERARFLILNTGRAQGGVPPPPPVYISQSNVKDILL